MIGRCSTGGAIGIPHLPTSRAPAGLRPWGRKDESDEGFKAGKGSDSLNRSRSLTLELKSLTPLNWVV